MDLTTKCFLYAQCLDIWLCCYCSVEHDFRQQEGRFQGVMEALEGEYDVPATIQTKTMPASSSSRPSTKAKVKKLRKKCFWWL